MSDDKAPPDSLIGEIDRLRQFAREMMAAWPHGDVDGADLQDAAVRAGILTEAVLHEPCGEWCECNCNVESSAWVQGVTCYRKTPWLLEGDE